MSRTSVLSSTPLIVGVLFGIIASRRWRGVERLVAAAILTYGSIAISLTAIGGAAAIWGQRWLRPPGGPLWAAALIAIAALAADRLGSGSQAGRDETCPPLPRPDRVETAGLVIGASLFLFAFVSGAVHPPSGYDALAYHLPLGLDFFQSGNLVDPLAVARHQWEMHQSIPQFQLTFPGSAELVLGLLLRSVGEHGVPLLEAPMGIVMALSVGRFAQELGGRPWLPIAGVLVAPIVLFQAGTGYTDLVAGACLTAAFLFAACGPARKDRLAVAALATGLAIATKPVVFPMAAVLAVVILWRSSRAVAEGERTSRLGWRAVVVGLFLLAPLVWWVRDLIIFQNPIFPVSLRVAGVGLRGVVGVKGGTGSGDVFVPTPAAWPLYPLFEKYSVASGYGAAFVVVALPAAAVTIRRRWANQRLAIGTWAAVTAAMLAAAIAFPLPRPRFQLVPAMLALAFIGSLPAVLPETRRAGGAIAIAALALTGIVATDRLAPLTVAPLDRASFNQKLWYTEARATRLGPGVTIWNDVSYSDFGYPATYPLMGPGHRQRVVDGLLRGLSPDAACARLDPRSSFVYVVSDERVPLAEVEATYGNQRFELLWTVSRGGPHGTQTRSLWGVTRGCRALASASSR